MHYKIPVLFLVALLAGPVFGVRHALGPAFSPAG